jgi:hypothetical protein
VALTGIPFDPLLMMFRYVSKAPLAGRDIFQFKYTAFSSPQDEYVLDATSV